MNTQNTVLKFHLEVAAESIIHQFMLTKEDVGKELASGIQKALETFDFEAEVRNQTHDAIRKAIRESLDYGKLRDLIKRRTEHILDAFIEKEIERFNNLKS